MMRKHISELLELALLFPVSTVRDTNEILTVALNHSALAEFAHKPSHGDSG